jgi:fluoroquinolone transport system permease protein
MKRLTTSLLFDVRIQQRYNFLVASIFSILVWVAVLMALPAETRQSMAPAIIYLDLALVGFYFIAGLILYEKGEATIYALVITPLRFVEYLASKLITLTGLAIFIALTLLFLTSGWSGTNLLWVVLGTALMSVISLLIGFIAVAPFTSFSSYLIPSQLPALVLYLPIISYLGLWDSPLFYLLPTQGAMLLLRGAYGGVESWQVLYAVLYGALWIVGLTFAARYVFNRYVVVR